MTNPDPPYRRHRFPAAIIARNADLFTLPSEPADGRGVSPFCTRIVFSPDIRRHRGASKTGFAIQQRIVTSDLPKFEGVYDGTN
ncbi:hypothetical protein ABK249_11300 [Neorhizobium sp. Rsf11]|uniref:Uncharacterized protein n=2 Tax=Neorhizobium TaxID=1525371 RepID=A0ABV0M0Y2_9HYPH|nr:hypothetical protein [Neorhizobium petrolearium]MCC2609351.1 hypothetical protein [Neorhizobium petrolearium]WGI71387.1 hypothetical protein QEO92_05675 [Neorhizobium petrolearium]